MASWGTERRNRFISIFLVIVLAIAAVYLIVYFSKPPTCFDNKKNGDETGIDCGGSCELICRDVSIAPVVHWFRYFEVVPGIYNVVSYVENLNSGAGVDSANYIFKLYDEKNVVLTERKGSVKIRPNEIIPIVEPALNTGKLSAVRSTFEFTDNLIWMKREPRSPVLVVSKEDSFEVDGLPRISGVLTNTSVHRVQKISVVAIVYDSTNNAIASSRTYFEKIDKDESVDLVFTWPQKFEKPINRFEIVPLYDTDF
jgi:hypothetical protein